jgi:hypothetical protein
MVLVLLLSMFALPASATEFGTVTESPLRGDSDTLYPEESLAEQFEELLQNSTSNQQRRIILEKAFGMGVAEEELPDITLSEADKAILSGRVSSVTSAPTNRAVITAPNSSQLNSSVAVGMGQTALNSVIVSGVNMPDYALWPTVYKQTTSSSCSAGTVYTVGTYIGANPPSQSTIMSFWNSQWGVTLPDLPLVRNYMNSYLPGKPADYVSYVHRTASQYANSQTTLNTDLKNNVLKYQPMILLMQSANTTYWPYPTAGHFCLCSGLLTWENNQYFIGDPYYFSSYPNSNAPVGAVGEHKESWTNLRQVLLTKGQGYLT